MDFEYARQLHQAIASVAPIQGVSVSPPRVDFLPQASEGQRAAAWFVLENFTPTPPPNFDAFLANFLDSDIDARLSTTNNERALERLNMTFTLRDLRQIEGLRQFWRGVILHLPEPLSPEEIALLNQWADAAHLPLRVNEYGLLDLT